MTGERRLRIPGNPHQRLEACLRNSQIRLESFRLKVLLTTASAPAARLRIGLHTGPAIVGNIGFPGRIDYTLVGDTVNLSERTQSALRGVHMDRPAVIAATQQTLTAQGPNAVLAEEMALPNARHPAFLCVER